MKCIPFLLLTLLIFSTFTIEAEEDATDSIFIIQNAINACIDLRDAASACDTGRIMLSAIALRECKAVNFNSLQCLDDTIESINGHLMFTEAFADSLAHNLDFYRFAEDMNRSAALRGQTNNGSIITRTCCVKEGKRAKYTFSSKGYQELAVVAEAGGSITLRIHVTNNYGLDEWHNDTIDVKRGRPQRMKAFNPPTKKRYQVELEVINCSKQDISFVIISN